MERLGMSRRRSQKTRTVSSRRGGKQIRLRRSSRRDVNYIDRGTSEEEIKAEPQREGREMGLLFSVVDPRYIGRETEEAGSVILNMDQVRQILQREADTKHCEGTV